MIKILLTFVVSLSLSLSAHASAYYKFSDSDPDITCSKEITAMYVALDMSHKNSENIFFGIKKAHRYHVSNCPLSFDIIVGTSQLFFEQGKTPKNKDWIKEYQETVKKNEIVLKYIDD